MSALRIFIGSEHDHPFLDEGLRYLEGHGIAQDVRVASVHRGPQAASAQIRAAIHDPDMRVLIAGAASATGLPGVIAGFVQEANSRIVVFGVRFEQHPSARIIEDASFALSSMPRGVPLAYTGHNQTGFLHACMLAARILQS